MGLFPSQQTVDTVQKGESVLGDRAGPGAAPVGRRPLPRGRRALRLAGTGRRCRGEAAEQEAGAA